jgi:hypothetical protein
MKTEIKWLADVEDQDYLAAVIDPKFFIAGTKKAF